MHIRIGYELTYECFQPAPMLLMLNTHPSRAADLIVPDHMVSNPEVPIRHYHDGFGNRCSRIPARYCTGYLGDIGVPPDPAPMDFSAWFEVFPGGTWYTFDARHNTPRIGRVLVARGRDAANVAISTTFGANRLLGFSVVTEEVSPSCPADRRHNRDDDAQPAEPASTMM